MLIERIDSLNIISSYTLLYNASLMVEEGLGYAICFDKLINTTGNSLLTYRPLTPSVNVVNELTALPNLYVPS